MNEIRIKDLTIEALKHQLPVHKSNIKVIGREGKNKLWYLHIWQLIIRNIINGTPP